MKVAVAFHNAAQERILITCWIWGGRDRPRGPGVRPTVDRDHKANASQARQGKANVQDVRVRRSNRLWDGPLSGQPPRGSKRIPWLHVNTHVTGSHWKKQAVSLGPRYPSYPALRCRSSSSTCSQLTLPPPISHQNQHSKQGSPSQTCVATQ